MYKYKKLSFVYDFKEIHISTEDIETDVTIGKVLFTFTLTNGTIVEKLSFLDRDCFYEGTDEYLHPCITADGRDSNSICYGNMSSVIASMRGGKDILGMFNIIKELLVSSYDDSGYTRWDKLLCDDIDYCRECDRPTSRCECEEDDDYDPCA